MPPAPAPAGRDDEVAAIEPQRLAVCANGAELELVRVRGEPANTTLLPEGGATPTITPGLAGPSCCTASVGISVDELMKP